MEQVSKEIIMKKTAKKSRKSNLLKMNHKKQATKKIKKIKFSKKRIMKNKHYKKE